MALKYGFIKLWWELYAEYFTVIIFKKKFLEVLARKFKKLVLKLLSIISSKLYYLKVIILFTEVTLLKTLTPPYFLE